MVLADRRRILLPVVSSEYFYSFTFVHSFRLHHFNMNLKRRKHVNGRCVTWIFVHLCQT
ncbi:hypothetical protein BDV59DRAFT_180925 [Aspergillus ambiguus]|uniref:uncharacterized protein n=1 Tax=Aspergillus ambiguus TaxID=176160 RepID=UPI003CCCCD72